jgi:hypothetical protein
VQNNGKTSNYRINAEQKENTKTLFLSLEAWCDLLVACVHADTQDSIMASREDVT